MSLVVTPTIKSAVGMVILLKSKGPTTIDESSGLLRSSLSFTILCGSILNILIMSYNQALIVDYCDLSTGWTLNKTRIVSVHTLNFG